MTDLVQKIREALEHHKYCGTGPFNCDECEGIRAVSPCWLSEAADEIERLTQAFESLEREAVLAGWHNWYALKDIREALGKRTPKLSPKRRSDAIQTR